MARTAASGIKIRNNGVALTTGAFAIFDLVSGISASDSGGGVAGFTSSAAAGQNIATETLTATTSGANITLDLTTLSHTFVAIEVVFRNGQALTPTADWSRSSNTITVTGATSSDVYQIQYIW